MKRHMILSIVIAIVMVAVTALAQQSAPVMTSPSAKAKGQAPAPSLTISRMEICDDVKDRNPVNTGSTYKPSQEKVFCYLEFTDVKKETTIKVVWTLGQNEMDKISLTIKPYARFRTWASKSINGMKGDWKVDVLDENGTVLKTATFKVQ